ncbi:MAG: hypothetical protein MK101_00365 [Phycisphaerales bacterium]|nr:hypothetical protein [Phycisphaerales bacterium]
MIRGNGESKAPRPSRRRGRRMRLKTEETVLRESVLASAWLDTVTALLGEEAMADGHLAARDGAVRRVDLTAGRIAGPVEADGEAPRSIAFTLPRIEDSTWNALVADMADEALYTARLLEGKLPPDLGGLFDRRGLSLVPPKDDGLCVEADERVQKQHWRPAALAWIVAEVLHLRPLEILTVRGLSAEALLERLRHHRTLRSAEGSEAHPVIQLDPDLARGEPITAAAAHFWRSPHHLPDVPHDAHPEHALLRRLGSSSLGGKFPLCGLLATIYDEIADEARKVQDD